MARNSKELYKREGSIYWWYRFQNPITSKQARGSTGTVDKKLAQKILDELKAQSWAKADVSIKKTKQPKLWIEATIRWLEVKQSKRSINDDSGKFKLLADILDHIPLEEITNDLIQEKVVSDFLLTRNISEATINRYLDLIRAVLNASSRWGWLDKVPFIDKPGKSGERQRKAWLTPNQFKRAHDAMSPLKANMMLLALCTGMRADNIITLHPSEVDIKNKRLFIPASKFKSKRDHTIPLNETAIALLKSQIGKHTDAVFTYHGEPIKRFSLKGWHEVFDEEINGELREAGLLQDNERFVFHGMRHTFATWLFKTGVPIEIIETIGGWSKGKRMVNVYTHMDDIKHLLPYVRKIDLILSGKLKI